MAIELTIVTPEGQAYEGPVETVVLPGAEGEFGVLELHERYLAPLKPGAVKIVGEDSTTHWAAISDGFADVSAEQVVVLVDRCAQAGDIDATAAETELAEAHRALDALSSSAEDEALRPALEARVEVARALVDVAGRR